MFKQHRLFFKTLDPVHVGTGGYRLGRVDLSILREPGTQLPKLPGTSLSGAARSYAAMIYEKPNCAGQGGGANGHCNLANCPICYTFGSVRGTEGGNAGVISFSDARILFFPVYSQSGPVWITSPLTWAEIGKQPVLEDELKAKWSTATNEQNHIKLGWLMLEKEADLDLQADGFPSSLWPKKIVLVSEKLFSQIVNSNLEVRTSVSINPNTGAAEEGALFTYEALPRATILWCDVIEDDYRKLHSGTPLWPIEKKYNRLTQKDNDGEPLAGIETFCWNGPFDVAKTGLQMIEFLGVGGMGTRGFGRIRLLEVDHA